MRSESQKKADEIINVINSINYQLDEGEFEPKMIYIIKEAYYSKDWYIIKTNEGIYNPLKRSGWTTNCYWYLSATKNCSNYK